MDRDQNTYIEFQGRVISFDGVLVITHTSRLEIDDSPSDDGTSQSERVTVAPREISMDVIVSDCYANEAQTQRCMEAYRDLEAVQRTRIPMVVVTKYGRHETMLIESMDTSDDHTTTNAWKASIMFRELLPVKVSSSFSGSGSSSDSHKTSTNNNGSTTSQEPDRSILSQVLNRTSGGGSGASGGGGGGSR